MIWKTTHQKNVHVKQQFSHRKILVMSNNTYRIISDTSNNTHAKLTNTTQHNLLNTTNNTMANTSKTIAQNDTIRLQLQNINTIPNNKHLELVIYLQNLHK